MAANRYQPDGGEPSIGSAGSPPKAGPAKYPEARDYVEDIGGDGAFSTSLSGPNAKGLGRRMTGDAYDEVADMATTQLAASYGTGEDMLEGGVPNLEVEIPTQKDAAPQGDERRGETPMPGRVSGKTSNPFPGMGKF